MKPLFHPPQTNNPAIGIGTNWITLSGSELTNAFIVPISTANGSVFLRLLLP